MRLEQLQFFVEVSRCRSISLAASRLFMTQQNVSSGIRKLEAELGFDLFERTPRGVVLTPQGEEVLVKAEEIIEEVESLKMIKHPAAKTKRCTDGLCTDNTGEESSSDDFDCLDDQDEQPYF